jgi:hypothetical protein
MRVFDPACGSGNFLIIAYRELRTLEMWIGGIDDRTNQVKRILGEGERSSSNGMAKRRRFRAFSMRRTIAGSSASARKIGISGR